MTEMIILALVIGFVVFVAWMDAKDKAEQAKKINEIHRIITDKHNQEDETDRKEGDR